MASISIDVPAGVLNRVLDAIAVRNGYNAAKDGTKTQFAKKWIIGKVKDEVRGHEGSAAGAAAQLAASTAVDTDINIT